MKATESSATLFNIELSPLLKQLVLKRGRLLLRGDSVPVRSLAGPDKGSAWLSGAATRRHNNDWEAAHELKRRSEKQLGQPIYVEPARQGPLPPRYQQLAGAGRPGLPAPAAEVIYDPLLSDSVYGPEKPDPLQSVMAGLTKELEPPTGRSRGSAGAAQNQRTGSNAYIGGFPQAEMPHVHLPTVEDLVPAQALDFLPKPAGNAPAMPRGAGEVKFAAITKLPGWQTLDRCTRNMLELEAAQLAAQISVAGGVQDIISALLELPDASPTLKHFLLDTAPDSQAGS